MFALQQASGFLNGMVLTKQDANRNLQRTRMMSIIEKHGIFISRFGAGAIAGCTAVMCCYPLDLVRTRLTTDLAHMEHYKGITDAIRKIVANEGFFGLYSGLTATLLVAVPSFAISYGVYGSLKEEVRVLVGDDLADSQTYRQTNSHMGSKSLVVFGESVLYANSLLSFFNPSSTGTGI